MQDFIFLAEKIVPDDTCDALVALGESGVGMQRATVHEDLKNVIKHARRNALLPLTEENCSEHLATLNQSFQQAYLQYVENFPILKSVTELSPEPYSMLRYDPPNDGYDWHSDGLDPGLRLRFITQVAYLNDVEEGGETEFLWQEQKVSPTRGSIAIFPSGWTHPHRALAPISGPKYVVTSFLRLPGPPI
jgi:hypothetical protein